MRAILRVAATLLLASFPLTTFAACSGAGQTVAYVNGVLTSNVEARDDLLMLKLHFFGRPLFSETTFINVYNPSHLAGAGDLAESVSQVLGTPLSDFDYTNMLQQFYYSLATRRVLLLGHSQGALYANSLYAYLLSHGEPKEAVGVYAVATPAASVAGGGLYLNSRQDVALSMITAAAQRAGASPPLPGNIDILITPDDIARNAIVGHSFVDAYLAGASSRIISDVTKSLARLVPTYASQTGDCFDAPPETITETFERGIFRIADPVAGVIAGATSRAVAACL